MDYQGGYGDIEFAFPDSIETRCIGNLEIDVSEIKFGSLPSGIFDLALRDVNAQATSNVIAQGEQLRSSTTADIDHRGPRWNPFPHAIANRNQCGVNDGAVQPTVKIGICH